MKPRFLPSVIFVLLVFTNCSRSLDQKNDSTQTLLQIDEIKENKEMLFSRIGKNIHIIQLDNACLMGQINKLAVSGENIYALDIDQCSCLCSFDETGNLIEKISLSEDRQFQFDAIAEMFILGDQLVVHDVARKSLFFLNKNLEVTRTEKVPFMANAIFPLNDTWLVFLNYRQSEYDHDFIVFDPNNGKVLERYLPVVEDEYRYVYEDRSTFAKSKQGSVYFSKAFNDTIYAYHGDNGLIPHILLNFGQSKLPKDYLTTIQDATDLMRDFLNGTYLFLHGNLHVVRDGNLLAQVNRGNRGYNIFIDVGKNEGMLFERFKDDYLTGLTFYNPLLSNESHFVFELSSENLSNSFSLPEDFILKFNPSPENNFLLVFLEK